MRQTLEINRDIIPWAIARAGFDVEEFVLHSPRVREWIDGDKKPTKRQLETFSKKVYLPFGYFFLPAPPHVELPIPFFRTEGPPTTRVSVNVYDTVILLQQRQSWLVDYLKDGEFEPHSFVGQFRTSNDPMEIAEGIRRLLDFEKNWASSFGTWSEALERLTRRIEDVGIIIVFNGVVENNTRRPIKVNECRGFVLVDEMAPFMFINNADAKAAQLFTIVHEMAHVVIGLSAGFDIRRMQPANDPNEVLCDKVAAEFLVPADSFSARWLREPSIAGAARFFKVSEIVIARRALDTGKISRNEFFRFYNEYINRESERRESQAGGGNFYLTTKKRLSLAFAAHIDNAVKSGRLLYRDAYRLTGLKRNSFETFFGNYLIAP